MARYRAGDWQVLVTDTAVVMVADETSYERVSALWEQLQSTPTLIELADTLIGGGGGSFAAIPPFAVALVEAGRVRIAVRGPLEVEAESAEQIELITGENVTIWNERSVAGATRLTLSGREADAEGWLPLQGGVVRASAVIFDVDDALVGAASLAGSVAPAAAPIPESAQQSEPEREPEPEIAPEPEPEIIPEPETEQEPQPEPAADPAPEPATEPVPEPEPVESSEPAPVGDETLIPGDTVMPEGAEPAGEEPDAVEIFDQLFADTVHSPGAAAPAPIVGDHDGETISVAPARALRKDAAVSEEAPTAVLPVVPAGHSGRIRLSTGQEVALDRTVIIGRRPRATRASGTDLPHLVAVESPQQDISRNHLEVRPEGDTVVVVDLHTTNGSTLLRPGADPVRLHPGEQTLVLSGDVIDLGDGVTVVFEELP